MNCYQREQVNELLVLEISFPIHGKNIAHCVITIYFWIFWKNYTSLQGFRRIPVFEIKEQMANCCIKKSQQHGNRFKIYQIQTVEEIRSNSITKVFTVILTLNKWFRISDQCSLYKTYIVLQTYIRCIYRSFFCLRYVMCKIFEVKTCRLKWITNLCK